MSSYWSKITETTNGNFTEDDFESAAYRLVMDQVIYYSDRGSKLSYNLIEKYEKDFVKALESLGIELKVDRANAYVVALPKHNKLSPVSKLETLFALVLRGIYEESIRYGKHYLSNSGDVYCNLHDLEEKYRLMVGEDLLIGKSSFEQLMRTVQRWGIARWVDEHEYPTEADSTDTGIAIRPAIVDVLGEKALNKLSQWKSNESLSTPEISINDESTILTEASTND